MKITKSQIKTGWTKVSLVTIICTVLLFGFLIFREIDTFEDNAEFFEEQFLNERKLELQREVLNRIDEIDYELSIIETKANELTKERIEHIDRMIQNLDQEKPEGMNQDDFIDKSMDILIEHAEHDPEYLYFSLGMDGTMHISGTDRNLHGVNIINSVDISGKYFVKDMIDSVIASENGEAFVTYYWPKVKDGEPLLKTSYCKYVESIDRIIGTGIYYEDLEKLLKEDIYKRFQAYYEGKDEYIFVITYDGIAKVFGDEKLIDRDIREIRNTNGDSIFEKFMEIVRNDGSGYYQYNHYERDGIKKSQKISFVKGLDQWNVYIGLGFYLDDFYKEVGVYRTKYIDEMKVHIAIFIIVFVCLVGIGIYFILKNIEMSKRYFKQEELLYEKFSNLTTEGILILDETDTIQFANPIAMKMLQIDDTQFGGYKKSDFIKTENGNIRVIGLNGHITYIESHADTIFYKEKDYTVMFLTDITKLLKYQESLKLTASTDQLTGLSNRRQFIEDFHKNVDNATETKKSFCMSIIDLDKFKQINDTYGHDIGDQVLKTFTKLFGDLTRDTDKLYRYGGEEFILILPNTRLLDAKVLLDRINTNIQEYDWAKDGLLLSYTAGLIEIESDNIRELDYYIKKMDQLLYKGKESGRKRVIVEA